MFRSGGDRGVSPVIGAILLVALTVVLAAGAGLLLANADDELRGSPSAAVEVTDATFTESEDCPGPEEVAIDVTLTQYRRADAITVIADGGETETVWADPGGDDVGTTKRVANEQVGKGGTDVDIGGGGDIAICPGDGETFRFYAESDGESLLLRTHTTG